MPIKEFYIKDVRCFAGKNSFRLRPLTLIIGENSTGKSTVLGCMQTLADSQERDINFNRNPYAMGSFVNIARNGRPFELGYTYTHEDSELPSFFCRVAFRKYAKRTEPVIAKQVYEFSDVNFILEFEPVTPDIRQMVVYIEKNGLKIKFWRFPFLQESSLSSLLQALFYGVTTTEDIDYMSRVGLEKKTLDKMGLEEEYLHKCIASFANASLNFRSLAPLRSAPERSYNPSSDSDTPRGSDVPLMLMNLSRNEKKVWQELRRQLIKYGEESGLFVDIDTRPFTDLDSDPFEIQVEAFGPKVNLIDVGYGVSQALPIIINIIRAKNSGLLIQQPEVHLHPRGQAALASLIIRQLKGGNGNGRKKTHKPIYVLETHSDYIVDRTRIEIRRGNIAPDDVALIYLEKTKKGANVHNITFDKKGNFENKPSNFRRFFLKETHRLLGFED